MGYLLEGPSGLDRGDGLLLGEVLTLGGLVRYFVQFVIDIETRRVQIAGIVRQPDGACRSTATLPTTSTASSRVRATSSMIEIRCSPTSFGSFSARLA
jgi:hypothetical protein